MIAHDVQQRSEEWFRLRYGKIGGTASKRLHTKGDDLMLELLACLCEEWEEEDTYASAAMQRGIDLEPFGIAEASAKLGVEFREWGWIESEHCPLLGLSPDGVTEDWTTAIELKCPGAKAHTKYCLEGGVPVEYVHQVCHYFTVIPQLERLWFGSYRWEHITPLYLFEVTPNTMLNFGTEARPLLRPVGEVALQKIELGLVLQARINESFNKILLT